MLTLWIRFKPHSFRPRASAERSDSMELEAAGASQIHSGGLNMHVGEFHHIETTNSVVNELGENEDWSSYSPRGVFEQFALEFAQFPRKNEANLAC